MLDARNVFDPTLRFLVKLMTGKPRGYFSTGKEISAVNTLCGLNPEKHFAVDKTFHEQAGADEQNKARTVSRNDQSVA